MVSVQTRVFALAFSIVPSLAHADDTKRPSSLLQPTDILVAVDQRVHGAAPIATTPVDERARELDDASTTWHVAGGIVLAVGAAAAVSGIAVTATSNRCEIDCEGRDVGGALLLLASLPVAITGAVLYSHGTHVHEEAVRLRRSRIAPAVGRNTVGIAITW